MTMKFRIFDPEFSARLKPLGMLPNLAPMPRHSKFQPLAAQNEDKTVSSALVGKSDPSHNSNENSGLGDASG